VQYVASETGARCDKRIWQKRTGWKPTPVWRWLEPWPHLPSLVFQARGTGFLRHITPALVPLVIVTASNASSRPPTPPQRSLDCPTILTGCSLKQSSLSSEFSGQRRLRVAHTESVGQIGQREWRLANPHRAKQLPSRSEYLLAVAAAMVGLDGPRNFVLLAGRPDDTGVVHAERLGAEVADLGVCGVLVPSAVAAGALARETTACGAAAVDDGRVARGAPLESTAAKRSMLRGVHTARWGGECVRALTGEC
jgi:hypothetical protein